MTKKVAAAYLSLAMAVTTGMCVAPAEKMVAAAAQPSAVQADERTPAKPSAAPAGIKTVAQSCAVPVGERAEAPGQKKTAQRSTVPAVEATESQKPQALSPCAAGVPQATAMRKLLWSHASRSLSAGAPPPATGRGRKPGRDPKRQRSLCPRPSPHWQQILPLRRRACPARQTTRRRWLRPRPTARSLGADERAGAKVAPLPSRPQGGMTAETAARAIRARPREGQSAMWMM